MERLTEWYDDGHKKGILVKEYPTENSLKTLYQKFGEQNDYSDCEEGYLGMEKLMNYENAEEQGLLLRLPCKVGDTVYYLYNEHILKDKVEIIKIKETYNRDGIIITIKTVADDYFYIENFGKTVFLTKEEAEQALAKNNKETEDFIDKILKD